MFFKLLNKLKELFVFTASYSNNVFLDPLSEEEEKEMLQRMKENDNEARNTLIEHNLRLVAHIVKKFDYKSVDQDDLISIGTIGLIKGVDTFQKSHGTKLTTYCAKCIENEILMYFRSNNKTNKNISLNESIGFDKEGNEINIIDILKMPSPDYINDISEKDNIKLLKQYFNVLTDREKEIIMKRYGLGNYEEKTQKDIAKEYKISRSYVSRIEKRALMKMLREYLKNNKE